MTTTIVAVSDLHAGSTVGLCPPEYDLYEEGRYRANKYQLSLWKRWEAFWHRAGEIARGRRWIVWNGDLVDGVHHRTTQLVSVNTLDHVGIAAASIRRAVEIYRPEAMFFVRGTGVHVGDVAQLEEMVAAEFRDTIPYEAPLSRWGAWIETDGVRFHFAHHTQGWGRPWTKTGAPGRESVMMVANAHAADVGVPDVSVRGHQHRFNDSGMATHPRVFVLPGWQLMSGFLRKIAPGREPEIGGIIFTVQDGEYTPHVRRWIIPLADELHYRSE